MSLSEQVGQGRDGCSQDDMSPVILWYSLEWRKVGGALNLAAKGGSIGVLHFQHVTIIKEINWYWCEKKSKSTMVILRRKL